MGIKIPILSDFPIINTFLKKKKYKINAIVKRLLLAGDKVMSEMHLKQSGFTYSAFGPFTKNQEWIKKIQKRRFKIYLSKWTW